MQPLLQELADVVVGSELKSLALVFMAVFARFVPVLVLVPMLGGRLVPAPLRFGVAAILSLLMVPSLQGIVGDWSDMGTLRILGMLVSEAFVGCTIGFVAAFPFLLADSTGRLIDAARGSTGAEGPSPLGGEPTTPMGSFFLLVAIVLFFIVDGHLVFLRSLAYTFELIPIGAGLAAAPHSHHLPMAMAMNAASLASGVLAATVGLAAPVLACMFLADVSLGLMNRLSPQMNVYFLGMPIRGALGILVVMLTLSALLGALAEQFSDAGWIGDSL